MRANQLLTLALVVLFFSSCKDEPATIGEEIFGGKLIGTKLYIPLGDTITARNVTPNSVDFKNKFNFLMLGQYNDPQFGSLKADFASELTISKSKSYGMNSLLNDTVMVVKNRQDDKGNDIKDAKGIIIKDTTYVLKYDKLEYLSGYYNLSYSLESLFGDTLAKQKVSVYRLASRLDKNTNYTSNFAPAHDASNLIGELEYYLKNNQVDTMWDESNYVHTLKVELEEVGLEIYNAKSDDINNIENFKEFFKGVFVTTEKTDASKGSLLRLNYRGVNQGINISYRGRRYETVKDDKDQTEKVITVYDTLSWSFPMNIECPKAVRYKSDYSNSAIDTSITNPEKIYLQGMGGSFAKIDISQKFIDKANELIPNPINRTSTDPITSAAGVELSFYLDTDTTIVKNFQDFLPKTLELYVKNDKGDYVIPRFETNGSNIDAVGGGKLESTADGAVRYSFILHNIFFEKLIYSQLPSDVIYNELYLKIPTPNFNFQRVILHGMSIENIDTDPTIRPSDLSVRYVKIN